MNAAHSVVAASIANTFAAAKAIFGGKGGKSLQAGDKLVQKDLAKTLEAIATNGNAGFYDGAVGAAIVSAMAKGGGDVTKEDLAGYGAIVRKPLEFDYRGFRIATMPPPSMGGIAIAEMLLEMERLHADANASDSAAAVHCFVDSAKRAYADRRGVGADPMAFQGTALDAAVANLCARLTDKPAAVLALGKRAFYRQLEQGLEQMQRLDELLVIAQRNALGVAQGFLKLGGEFVHSHIKISG